MNFEERKKRNITALEKIADAITSWIGSVQSVVVHTLFFIICFALPILHILDWDKMFLVLTTVVSLEAIYLSIFIQMSVNKSHEHIEDLKEDVTEIQEDIEDIQEDIEEISEDIEEINEDIDEIQEDIEEINEDEDDEPDHTERARTVMLKSKVSNNKADIRSLKDKIETLQQQLEMLKKEEDDSEENV